MSHNCPPLFIIHEQTRNSLKSFTIVILLHVAFAISLFGNEIWATLVFISFLSGLVYSYESTAICFSFPNASQGIIFALVYLVGSLFAFVQIPITDQVKEKDSLLGKILFNIYVLRNLPERLQDLSRFLQIFKSLSAMIISVSGILSTQ